MLKNSVERKKRKQTMAALVTTSIGPNERKWNKNEQSILGTVTNDSKAFSFTIFDLSVFVLSAFSIVVDLCTDLVLVFQYSVQGYKAWAVGTFVLIFFPSIIIQFFSLRWHILDKNASVLHWVLHFFMLGIIQRYFQIIKTALSAYKTKNLSDIQKVLLNQNDLCMLHLFESFLESAPQLVLQMYVIAKLHEWRFWTGLTLKTEERVSVLASFLSLAWALAAYTKAQRQARPNKNLITWPGLFLQAAWRTGMLTARISTLVLGAYCFGYYIFLLITIHWIAMTVWIIYQKTDFCETDWEEKLYNAIVGVIYCFCFFNLQEGQSRWRALAFYLVTVIQNFTCLTIFLMWFGEITPRLAVSGFIAVVGGTILGSTSMLFYYRFFHPSGPIKFIFTNSPAIDKSLVYSTNTLRTLKRRRFEEHSNAAPKNLTPTDSKNDLNKTSLSDSVVIVEENVLDYSDPDIKTLKNWINEINEKKPTDTALGKNEINKTEAETYKRRPICTTADLVKLIESENGILKLPRTDEASSEILSAHDYENLCAVNIARETWGLRSWRGYSDIETWLHDDSVVHDRRLDTLTSTTSSDRSANIFPKDNDRTRQDDYIDAIAEDLAQCESEASSDDVLGQYSIESLPVTYPLNTLDPILEEIEDASNDSPEYTNIKIRNASASTLVATIDEIRRNTVIQNHYPTSESIYDDFPNLSDIKPKHQKNWKKVTFASELLTFSEYDSEHAEETEGTALSVPPSEITVRAEENKDTFRHDSNLKVGEKEKYVSKNMYSSPEIKISSKLDISNKENIPTVASKINYWNKILNTQNEHSLQEKVKISSSKKGNVLEKKSTVLIKVLTPPNFPIFQGKRKVHRI